MKLTTSPIQNLINLSRSNNQSGHTRTCEQMFDAAQAEHAALVAVAEAAAWVDAKFPSFCGGPDGFAQESLRSAIANLAAVRRQSPTTAEVARGVVHNRKADTYRCNI